MSDHIKISDLYDLDQTIAKEYLEKFEYPWEALAGIKNFIKELSAKKLSDDELEAVLQTALSAADALMNKE